MNNYNYLVSSLLTPSYFLFLLSKYIHFYLYPTNITAVTGVPQNAIEIVDRVSAAPSFIFCGLTKHVDIWQRYMWFFLLIFIFSDCCYIKSKICVFSDLHVRRKSIARLTLILLGFGIQKRMKGKLRHPPHTHQSSLWSPIICYEFMKKIHMEHHTCFTSIPGVSLRARALVTVDQVSTRTPIQTRVVWTLVCIWNRDMKFYTC